MLASPVALSLRSWEARTASAAPITTSEEEALRALAALHPIDAHVHVFKTSADFQAMLEQEQLTLLDVLVVDDTWAPRNQLQPQIDDAWKLAQSSKGRVFLCTTFDGYKFNSPTFVEGRLWLKNNNGKYVLPDDSRLTPIYQDIAEHDKTPACPPRRT
jgi:hypothetical protein